MKRINYVNVVSERAIAADGVQSFDLGTNPLSVLLLNLRPLNETATLTNYQSAFGLAQGLTMINILYRGTSIIRMSGRDAMALNLLRFQMDMLEPTVSDTNNDRRCFTLPIVMGRFPFEASSCFPKTQRGEFTVELTFDVAAAGYDGMNFSIDAIEMPDANPSEYERRLTIERTFTATGRDSIALPIGNDIRGLLLFGTTAFTGASPAPTFGNSEIVVDNEQWSVLGIDWEVLKSLQNLRGGINAQGGLGEFVRAVGGAYAAGAASSGLIGIGSALTNYAYHRMDVLEDDEYSLSTAGRQSVLLRVNAETANACRVIPIEKVKV